MVQKLLPIFFLRGIIWSSLPPVLSSSLQPQDFISVQMDSIPPLMRSKWGDALPCRRWLSCVGTQRVCVYSPAVGAPKVPPNANLIGHISYACTYYCCSFLSDLRLHCIIAAVLHHNKQQQTKMNLYQNDGKVIVGRTKMCFLWSKTHKLVTMKHGEGHVMTWACMVSLVTALVREKNNFQNKSTR